MIYVYGLIESGDCATDDVCGLDDRSIEFIGDGALAAICTHHEQSVAPIAENLWRHERVLEAIMMDDCPLLPARFGTLFDRQEQLNHVLTQHRSELIRGLSHVRGCVELGVRVINQTPKPDPATTTSPTSGRDYMLQRLAAEKARRGTEQIAEHIAAALNVVLGPLARDRHQTIRPSAGAILNVAYLVPRGAVDNFVAATRQLAGEHPSWKLLCTGPWPAYHFAPPLTTVEATHAAT